MNVSKITENEVRRMYGDTQDQKSASNAYLLMYRRMAPTTEKEDVSMETQKGSIPEELKQMAQEIPELVRKEIDEENQKYLEEKRVHQEKLDTLTLRIFYGNEPVTISIHKAKSVHEATVSIFSFLMFLYLNSFFFFIIYS